MGMVWVLRDGLRGLACAYVGAFWLLAWRVQRWFLRRVLATLGGERRDEVTPRLNVKSDT